MRKSPSRLKICYKFGMNRLYLNLLTFSDPPFFENNLDPWRISLSSFRQESLAYNLNHRTSQRAQTPKTIFRFIETISIAVLIFLFCSPLLHAEFFPPQQSLKKPYTILLYLNGDNNLTHEVLYAVDMLETVGSSNIINILALVDGRPDSNHAYGDSWDKSKLLYITPDFRIGEINSVVLQDLGEQNLGAPETLEFFIKKGFEYPAERYIFCTFTHGRGIIDTKTLAAPKQHKSLAISVDETDGTYMTLQEFRHAIRSGLNGTNLMLWYFSHVWPAWSRWVMP